MNIKKLIFNISIPLIMGIIVSLFINTDDYKSLIQPPLAPSSIIFPVVWSILYILMGISTYIISIKDEIPFIYYVNLFFNGLWSIIFFTFKLRGFSIIWLIALIIILIIMIIKFYKINKKAGLLQIPYLIWCLFALYLNIGIYLLN